jgi:23S rRNA (uracil1939-C5)-methyltransferase
MYKTSPSVLDGVFNFGVRLNHEIDDPSQSRPDLTELQIESVAFGGNGVARKDSKVYFVAGGLPGDRVLARVTEDKGRYFNGAIERIIEPGPHRGNSPCKFSERCGGCQWLTASYQEQLKWKLNFVTSSLQRIGRLTSDEVSITGSPDRFGYRNRIHLKAAWENTVAIGYYRSGTHDLVAVDHCMIADPLINSVLKQIEAIEIPIERRIEFRFEMQKLENADGSPMLALTVFPNQPSDTDSLRDLIQRWRSLPEIGWIGFMFEAKNAPYFVYEKSAGIVYHTRPGIFQQVNVPANQNLRQLLHDKITKTSPTRILDLFCGSGNFSLGLANAHTLVEGSEFSRGAIDCAKHNQEVNQIENASYLPGDSIAHAWKIAKKHEQFSHIIADPPRDGLYKAVNPLLNIMADHIFYISCDPATLARDLGKLCRNAYRIDSVHAFDFFPNTYHVETLVHLVRQ